MSKYRVCVSSIEEDQGWSKLFASKIGDSR